MGTENYYEILGIGRDAKDEAVKQAFRELAKHCHPDRNPGNSDAEQQFKRINTAYEALKDADRREAYREWLEFADKREQSKKTQWTRLSALILLLGIGPVAVTYWVIWGIITGDIGGTRPTPVAVVQTEQPAPGASPSATTGETKTAPAPTLAQPGTPAPAQPGTAPKETVVKINRPEEQQGQPEQPQTVGTVPTDTGTPPEPKTDTGTPPADAPATVQQPASNAEQKTEPQQVASLDATQPGQSSPAPPAQEAASPDNIGVSQFSDCEECPTMAVMPAEEQRRITQFEFERHSVAISRNDVSVAEWDACVTEGRCPRYNRPGSGDPRSNAVLNIPPQDAQTYVEWLSHKTGKSYRLVALPPGDASTRENREVQQAERDARRCSEASGWEWLEEMQNGACKPASAQRPQSAESGKGFRVARVVTWTPD